jgi:hypothetical protein
MLDRSLLLLPIWISSLGCESSSASLLAASPCRGVECQSAAGALNKPTYVLTLASAGDGAGGMPATAGAEFVTASLCGVDQPSCNPDDSNACRDATYGSAGTAGNSMRTPGSAGATVSQNAAGGRTGTTPLVFGCRVRSELSGRTAQCEPAGQGILGAPCFSGADCAPGLACVEGNGTAQCRPYCCRGGDNCPSGTFCDQRQTRESSKEAQPITISVCMPATDCRFDDPYPCPVDRTCSCPSGTACGVVRSDGTTACVAPGNGSEGQPCPCAAGHVCSDTLHACLKVCRLTSKTSSCGDGICQESANLAQDWGVCVTAKALQ